MMNGFNPFLKYNDGNPEFSWSMVLSVSPSVYVFLPNFLSIIDLVSPVTISIAHTSSNCSRTSIPSSMSYYTLRPFRYPASLLCPINAQVSLLLFYFYFEWVHPCIIIIISLPNCGLYIARLILLLRPGQSLNKFKVDWNVCIIHSTSNPSLVLYQLPYLVSLNLLLLEQSQLKTNVPSPSYKPFIVLSSAVTGLVRLLVGWLEQASKSQPVRSFDWLPAGWFWSSLINRVTS